MEKKHKIAIVNFITSSRIIGTLLLPLIFSLANPLITILSVIGLYLTDLIDGQLAKNIWHVSTLGGAVLDAVSDKILNFAILIYASLVCPPMISLLITEIVIGLNNIYGTLKGADIKSCLTGKIKMFILGVTIAATFIPSISKTLLNALTFLCLSTQILALGEYNDVIKKKVITNSSKKVNLKEIFSKLKSKKEIKEILFNPEYYEKNFDKKFLTHQKRIMV